MKRGTIEHHKTADLAEILKIPRYAAVGILESLWHATAKYAVRGDIGHLSDKQIAHHVAWDGDPQVLVNALVEARWIDLDDTHRLLIHDWAEHADESAKKTAKNRGVTLLSGTFSKVLEKSRLPEPEPEPVPKPEPSGATKPVTPKTGQVRGPLLGTTVPQVLRSANIDDPALSVLVSAPGITIEMVRSEWDKCQSARKPNGALVARLVKRLSVTLPKGSPELNRILDLIAARKNGYV